MIIDSTHMDLGDFANYQQGRRNAENAAEAARHAAESKRELEKIRKIEQEKSDAIQSQIKAKQDEELNQTKLFELNRILLNYYNLLFEEPSPEKVSKLSEEFLEKRSYYTTISDHGNYTSLEFKELAVETRGIIDKIYPQASYVNLINLLILIKNDYDIITTQPNEDFAIEIANKYSTLEHCQGEQEDEIFLKVKYPDKICFPSNFEKVEKIREQAETYVDAIYGTDWVQWACSILKANAIDEMEQKKQENIEAEAARYRQQQINKQREREKNKGYIVIAGIVFVGVCLMIWWAVQ